MEILINHLLEYLILPSFFLLIPRMNQFLYERVINKNKVSFFEENWNWLLELSIVYFLSYLALAFRLSSENLRLSIWTMLFIPLIEIGLIAFFYIKVLTNTEFIKHAKYICFSFGLIILLLILNYHFPMHEFNNYILILSKNGTLIRILFLLFFALFLIFLSITLKAYLKTKNQNKVNSEQDYNQIFSEKTLTINEAMKKFDEYERKYGLEKSEAIHYWMQKISYLKENNFRLSAISEIIKMKQTKMFQNISANYQNAVIMFQINLLIEEKDFYSAEKLIHEFSLPFLKLKYEGILNKIQN